MRVRSHDTAERPRAFLRKSCSSACVKESAGCIDTVYFWLTFSDFHLLLGAVLFSADLKQT